MLRLIATDLDGTLLSPDDTISERNKQAIISALNQGIEVIIATGRSFPEAYIPVEEAGLILPCICINGAEIRSENKELISSVPLSKKQVTQAMNILENQNIQYDLFVGEYIYTLDIERQINMFINLGISTGANPVESKIRQAVMDRVEKGFILEVDGFKTVLKEFGDSINKVLGMCNDSNKQFYAAIQGLKKLSDFAISSSGNGNIEITNVNAQKGLALEKFTEIRNVNMKNVMVIGDSYNDVSMMEIAGISVAMGNAPSEIKDKCSQITADFKNDGFAIAIEDILKGEKY